MTSPEDADPQPAPDPDDAVHLAAPRPGHGTVWVNGSEETQWFASWQDEGRVADSPMGSREEAIAWAQAMPAGRRAVFSADSEDYEDLA